ncbi:MAG: hypothetical protein JF616_02505 [Fibrobacteres bacterium]|nr:hypothetical protein [Fibrobacterota bacterium]
MAASRQGPVLAMVLGLCLGGASALGTLNPYFTQKSILPSELANISGIGGMDLLPNGDGVICTWGGSMNNAGRSPATSNGEVWIIPALATGSPGVPVRIAQGLREPMGVKVVGPDFYVMEKPRLVKFSGSGATWTQSTLWTLPDAWYNDAQYLHFSFGLEFKDSAFWITTAVAFPLDPDGSRERGALMKIAFDGSGFTQYARGLREPDGIGLGPENEVFTTENQGEWKPTNALYWIPTPGTEPAKHGRFYGYRTNLNNDCHLIPYAAVDQDNCPSDPVYPPAVWLPYGSFTNSPTRPILLKSGAYAGQMMFGDIYHGGIFRTFLEKVNGEWQGAAFALMDQRLGYGGVQFGIHQFLYTPSGSILVAGIGGGACGLGGEQDWNWRGTCRGLDLLIPTDSVPFDILAIRSVRDGFDVELTEPANSAAGLAANWTVKTTVYTPVQEHGGDFSASDNNVRVAVDSAILSGDGKHVRLKMATLLPKRMYAITADSAVKSAGGSGLWTNVGYYTLNSVNALTRIVPSGVAAFARRIHGSSQRGHVSLAFPFQGAWSLDLLRLDGSRISRASGTGPSRFESGALPAGLYILSGRGGGGSFSERIRVW